MKVNETVEFKQKVRPNIAVSNQSVANAKNTKSRQSLHDNSFSQRPSISGGENIYQNEINAIS